VAYTPSETAFYHKVVILVLKICMGERLSPPHPKPVGAIGVALSPSVLRRKSVKLLVTSITIHISLADKVSIKMKFTLKKIIGY